MAHFAKVRWANIPRRAIKQSCLASDSRKRTEGRKGVPFLSSRKRKALCKEGKFFLSGHPFDHSFQKKDVFVWSGVEL